MRRIKFFLKILSGVILIILLILFALGYYLKSQKQEIIEEVESWYSENHTGVLKFGDVSVSNFDNFPSVAFIAKDLEVSDTIYSHNQTEVLKIAEIHLLVSLEKLIDKQIQFKSLKIKNGSLQLITQTDGSNNHHVFKSIKKDSVNKSGFKQWFSEKGFKIVISSFDITVIDLPKNEEVTGHFNALNLEINAQEEHIQLKSINLKNGFLKLVKNAPIEGYIKKPKDSSNPFNFHKWVSKDKSAVKIENFDISIQDFEKNKRITGTVNAIKALLEFDEGEVKSHVEIDVEMDELGLNLSNGTFFNGANVKGIFQPIYNFESETILVPNFDLSIDNQRFKVGGTIYTSDSGTFDFSLENEQTYAEETIALLSQNIQEKLKRYHLAHPFYISAIMQGSFAYRSNPLVKIRAKSSNNLATIENLSLTNLSFKGDFVNRVIDPIVFSTESKKNLSLHFDYLNASYKGIPFEISNSSYTSTPKDLNYYNLNLNAKAPNTKLNELFDSETFLFSKGNFSLTSKFKGNADSIDNLLVGTSTDLTLGKSEIIYAPLLLPIGIDKLEFELLKTDAFLESLIVSIGDGGDYLEFSGDILNATSLVFDYNDKVKSEVQLKSSNLRWKDFIEMFKKQDTKNESKEVGDKKVLNEVLKGIYKKFNPSLEILIDNFHYKKFEASHIRTDFYFDGERHLYLERTGFNYNDKNISMDIFLDISDNDETLFDLRFDTENLDFGSFLEEFNYFELSSFQEIEKLSGYITLDVALKGKIDYVVGLNTSSLKGKVFFELNEVEVVGFKPLEKVANKIFRKERFEAIKFAPISNTVFIENRTIEIPQMQIQSTAFDLFVEGHLNYDHKTNIWVSIPLSNLKKRDIKNIPNAEEYANTGKKVFIEIKENDQNELNYKLHLNNKKLYEEKGFLNQYKELQKSDRLERKTSRKEERQKKRVQRKTKN